MIIKGLKFVQTCSMCPEQYEVYDSANRLVGYIRLRWGSLTCEYPDVGGELVYMTCFDDDMRGFFVNEKERAYHLNEIADRLNKKLKRRKRRRG